jgi:hypothetical protein
MKSAIQLIRETDRGQLLRDFEGALEEIITDIENHNGAGTGEITIKLTIKAKGDAYIVAGDLKHKVPKRQRVEALFFFDGEQGELTRKDPRQPDLPSVVDADELNRRRSNVES